MTKEPQLTTHNVERGAHSTCRERSETGSSPKRTEEKGCCSPIGKSVWRFGENVFGDLEKTYSVFWRKRVRRFGENEFGDLKKTWPVIWRKHIRRFGENVFGVLEKTSSAIWRKRGRRSYGDYVLEFVMK